MSDAIPTWSGPRRIAVLGAGGFLGSHLVTHLVQHSDAQLDAVDLSFDKLTVQSDRLHRTRASVTELEVLAPIIERNDVVLSLTALCNPALYNTQPLEVIDASYTDLVPLLDLCAQQRRWLVHFSTCEVYGRVALDADGQALERMSEEQAALVLAPIQYERWTYACAKQLLERRIWGLGKHHGLPFTIVRPFNVVGPRMDFLPGIDGDGVPRVLACFMHALLAGEPLPLVDGGRHRRSFILVDDFIEAVRRLLERRAVCAGEVINIGNPRNEVSIAELAEQMCTAYTAHLPGAVTAGVCDVSAEVLYGEGYDDSVARIPDIDKAQRLLDWTPAMTLADGLPAIIDDYVARYGDAVQAAVGTP